MITLQQYIPSTRRTFLLIFAACTGMILTALVMQYLFKLEPCPLCISQRVAVIIIGIIACLAWIHNPEALGTRVYAVIGTLTAIGGAGISSRHLWLQSLPEDMRPACGPGIRYLFEALPFWDALSLLFKGDGNCAEVLWRFLGLSIPGWTLVCFVGLGAVFVWQGVRAK